MNTQKIIKYILIAIPLLFLAKWGIETVIYDSNKIPEVNPHPTQKVRIHGKFPFDKNITISHFTVNYKTNNPQCNKEYIIAGAEFARKYRIDIPVVKHKNQYEAYYYLDYLLPGSCKWTFDSFQGHIDMKNMGKLGIFFDTSSPVDGLDYYSYNEKKYIYSNSLIYDCHITKTIYKNLSSSRSFWCHRERSDSDQALFPYKNARDITQNYIYSKEKTEWTK